MGGLLEIEPDLVARYVAELAQYGASHGIGVSRTAYSPEWVAAQEQVRRWCVDARLESSRDAVGNVGGRLPGTDGGRARGSGGFLLERWEHQPDWAFSRDEERN